MEFETLNVGLTDDVLDIQLNRPDRLNAINVIMLTELRQVIEELGPSSCAILLRGNERAFCAGQDLKAVDIGDEAAGLDVEGLIDQYYNPLIRLFASSPRPIVAAVRGVAAGAGCSLALAADIVVASDSASFDEAFVRIGLIPDCGASYVLPRLVGQARATAMLMLGEAIDGRTAAEWGLIWKAVPDEESERAARSVALKLARSPSTAIGLIKGALRHSASATLDSQLDHERDGQLAASKSVDFAEGLKAFAEKRPAVFTGK